MKLASFEIEGRPTWGVIAGDKAFDIGATLPDLSDLRAAIAAGAWDRIARAQAKVEAVPVARIAWLPVIPDPAKILCVGINYEEHRQETGRSLLANPVIFSRFSDSQSGHERPLIRPAISDSLDFEGELAVIIGTGGRNIAAADAMRHVAGYACYNDVTVRAWQNHTHQWIPGKNFLGLGVFGPWMVTVDEIADVEAVTLETRLNGTVMQHASVSQMIFPIPRLIEYCSTFTRLAPGDVIVSGTPGGVGAKRNPPVFMQPGDVIEIDISGIGVLRNAIVAED